MLALSATGVGAVIGLALGAVLALVVAVGDWRLRRRGQRTAMEFKISLLAVPLMLAGVGAVLGWVVGLVV